MEMKELLIKNYITSLIGLTVMGFVAYRFLKNLDEFTGWFQLSVYGIGLLIGFLLFRSKDTWLISKAQEIANGLKGKINTDKK